MSDLWTYLQALAFNWMFYMTAFPLVLDDLIRWFWPPASEWLESRISKPSRRKWEIRLMILGFLIAGFWAFQSEHTARVQAERDRTAASQDLKRVSDSNLELSTKVESKLTDVCEALQQGASGQSPQMAALGDSVAALQRSNQNIEQAILESSTNNAPVNPMVNIIAEAPPPPLHLETNALDLNVATAYLNGLELQKEAKEKQQAELSATQVNVAQRTKEWQEQLVATNCYPVFKYIVNTFKAYLGTIAQQRGDSIDISGNSTFPIALDEEETTVVVYQMHENKRWRFEISLSRISTIGQLHIAMIPDARLYSGAVLVASFALQFGPEGSLQSQVSEGDSLWSKTSAIREDDIQQAVCYGLNVFLAQAQKEVPVNSSSHSSPR